LPGAKQALLATEARGTEKLRAAVFNRHLSGPW
jgi:hypothetical protein